MPKQFSYKWAPLTFYRLAVVPPRGPLPMETPRGGCDNEAAPNHSFLHAMGFMRARVSAQCSGGAARVPKDESALR